MVVVQGKQYFVVYHERHDNVNNSFLKGEQEMVEFVKISNQGTLLKITEVSDIYRDHPYS
ncbi:hypothetical protein AYK25_07805 [Thermoplasmatales archaeon SM1-50]|nr:MAG: hypothetical protein AYK25_07805 [Thermoplasmatales archaeon SM1-50]